MWQKANTNKIRINWTLYTTDKATGSLRVSGSVGRVSTPNDSDCNKCHSVSTQVDIKVNEHNLNNWETVRFCNKVDINKRCKSEQE